MTTPGVRAKHLAENIGSLFPLGNESGYMMPFSVHMGKMPMVFTQFGQDFNVQNCMEDIEDELLSVVYKKGAL